MHFWQNLLSFRSESSEICRNSTGYTYGGETDLDNLTLLCRRHHRLHHEGGYTIAMVDGRHPHFYRPDGTQITPPGPPPPDSDRGSPTLRRHHAAAGTRIDRSTPGARSGGAPDWSPQHALDGLLK